MYKGLPFSRTQYYRRKKKSESLGCDIMDVPDTRGKHHNHVRGSNHYRWNNEKIESSHGYIKVRVGIGHPLADPNGYAYEHVLVVLTSDSPGAYLLQQNPDKWLVHHLNEDKSDNRIENLAVIERSEHSTIHNEQRPRDELGRFTPEHQFPEVK